MSLTRAGRRKEKSHYISSAHFKLKSLCHPPLFSQQFRGWPTLSGTSTWRKLNPLSAAHINSCYITRHHWHASNALSGVKKLPLAWRCPPPCLTYSNHSNIILLSFSLYIIAIQAINIIGTRTVAIGRTTLEVSV